MKVTCLASSSAGNCYIMDFEVGSNHTLLMVECGLPYIEIVKRANQYNVDLSKVESCIITHGHSDHCMSAKDLNLRGVKIYASENTLNVCKLSSNKLEVEKPQKVANGVVVWPFEVEHDIDGAYGFVIKTAKETVIFINDCKLWKTNLINFKPDYVFIECNYNHSMVYAQLHALEKENEDICISDALRAENSLRIEQHKRNINSHMSLHGTKVGLSRLNLNHCKAIFLMHMSDRYANEYLMKNEIYQLYRIPTYACKKIGGTK